MADNRAGESARRNLLQATEERNPRERPKLVANALRAYTDKDGRFEKLPRKILQDAIQRPGNSAYSERRAARLVAELLKTGWLENRQTRKEGVPGLWYLRVERLNPADDTTLMTQAVRAANDIRRSYPDPKLRQLIAELLGRDEP